MNYDDYKLLCKTCDSILEKNKSIYRVAIPLLHVLKEHPFILKQYQSIFKNSKQVISKTPRKKIFFDSAYKKVLSLLTFERLLFKDIKHKKIDVVFISHLVNAKHLDLESDFYFSNIPEFLKSEGINSLLMLINHTNESTGNLSKKNRDAGIPRIMIPKKLTLSGEVKILTGAIKELISMRKESNRTTGFFKNSLRFFSSFNGFRGALFGLRMDNYVRQVLSHFKPVVVITIYEGHAWERLVYNAVAQKNILRIGYQHSIVTRYSHAMCRSLGRSYDPDIIYTSGTVTNNHLTKKLEGSHTKVITLGSNKLLNITSVPKVVKKTKTCLVIPEGLDNECEILFRFTLQCASKLTNVNFIWRLHPQLSFSEVLGQMNLSSKDIPKNITISKLLLIEDINLSTHVLYRGSAAVIESIYGGLIPMYLSDGSDMTIDLLHGISSGRKIINNFDDLSSALSKYSENDIKNLQCYCEKYFTQLDYSILTNEIKTAIKKL